MISKATATSITSSHLRPDTRYETLLTLFVREDQDFRARPPFSSFSQAFYYNSFRKACPALSRNNIHAQRPFVFFGKKTRLETLLDTV